MHGVLHTSLSTAWHIVAFGAFGRGSVVTYMVVCIKHLINDVVLVRWPWIAKRESAEEKRRWKIKEKGKDD